MQVTGFRTEDLEVNVTPPALKMLNLKYHKRSDSTQVPNALFTLFLPTKEWVPEPSSYFSVPKTKVSAFGLALSAKEVNVFSCKGQVS